MDGGARTSRRAVLAATAATATSLAGCGGTLSAGRDERDPVSLLVAGSLQNATENGLAPAVDLPVTVEAHGSAAAARFVAEGQKDPDVVALADVALFDSVLDVPWHVTFATNSLVVAYDPDSPGGQRVAAAGTDGWHEAIRRDDVALGRTDPDLDPLGYRTLFALEFATDHYDTAVDLRAAVPERRQVYPETQLLAALETGSVDAAVVYRSMAVDRGYPFVDLPAAVDLGDPDHADSYATATYELPDGTVARGGVVRYGTTARRTSPAIRRTVAAQVDGGYLREYGFTVPADYPRGHGAVPDGFADRIEASTGVATDGG